jgi:predicted MFS family arabinose efflux permease
VASSESNLRSPIIGKKDAKRAAAPQSWRLFNALIHFRAFEALRHREYRLLMCGQVFASMGQWMDEITRGWLIYELTHSAVQLGLVRGIQIIPYLFLSPVAGSAADRFSRKTQVVVSQFVNALVYIATALLIFTGQIRPWHVYVTAFLMAITQVFQQPARVAMISDAVPATYLTNAIGLNAMINNMSRSIGPALAGMLIAMFGTDGTYSVQAVFYFLATVWTVQLRSVTRSSTSTDSYADGRESFGQSIIEGWKFSWRNEAVRVGLLTVMFANLFIVPFTTLLPVFARDILAVGSAGQGFLLTAMGVGALCSAALIASAGEKLPRGMLMLGSVMVYGLVLVVFAASSWFQLSLVMMVFAGLCHVHSHALVQTVIQSYSPSEYRGRTMALFSMSKVLMIAGSMLVGTLSSLLGARWAVASMGAAGVLTMIMMLAVMPQARRIQ